MVKIKSWGFKKQMFSYVGNFHRLERFIVQGFQIIKIFLSLLFFLEYLIKATHSLDVLEFPLWAIYSPAE